MSYKDLKDEIAYLNSQIKGNLRRLQIYQDSEYELRTLKESMQSYQTKVNEVEKESMNGLESSVKTFSYYKQLIKKAKDRVNQVNSQRSSDIFNRMELDKQRIISQISLIDNHYSNLLDDLLHKILNLNLIKDDFSEDQNQIDKEVIKQRYLEIKQLKDKIMQIFNEIHDIYTSTKEALSKEYDCIEWEINIISSLFMEMKRVGEFVPSKELFNPQLLAQLGMADNEYSNYTSLAILTNININLKQRREEIKPYVDKIQQISKKLLLNENSVMNLIKNILNAFNSIINFEETKGNKKNVNLIEEIFNEAKKINSSQCESLADLIGKDFDREIEEMKRKIEEENEKRTNRNNIANEEFKKRWNKLVNSKCNEITNKFKQEALIYFSDKKDKYVKDIDKIVDTFSENTKKYIPKSLLGCKKEIESARDKYKNFQKLKNYALLIGGDESILNRILNLNYQAYRSENKCYANNNETLRDYIKGIFSLLPRNIPFEALSISLVFPIKIEEIDNEKNYLLNLFNYALELDIGFSILIIDKDLKTSDYFEKKNELTLYFKQSINEPKKKKHFQQIEDLFITNLDDLSYNLGKLLDYIFLIKRDYCLTLNLGDIEKEYFDKMYNIYHTTSRVLHTESIQNAENEALTRTRLFNAIYEFSIDSITLREKIEIKEGDNRKINSFISKFLDKLYTDNLKQDCEDCLRNMSKKMVAILYIEREGIRAQIDNEFDSDLCLEDLDIDEVKQKIDNHIMEIILKKFLSICEKEGGKIMWIIFYDEYCANFYKFFKKGFEMPIDFNKFFRENEEEMEMQK